MRSSIVKLFLIVGYAVLIEGFVLIRVFYWRISLHFTSIGHNKSLNDSLTQTILFEVK